MYVFDTCNVVFIFNQLKDVRKTIKENRRHYVANAKMFRDINARLSLNENKAEEVKVELIAMKTELADVKLENEFLKQEIIHLKLNSTQDYDYSAFSTDYSPQESEVTGVIDEITKKSVEILNDHIDTHYSKLKKKAKKIDSELSRLSIYTQNMTQEVVTTQKQVLNVTEGIKLLSDKVAEHKIEFLNEIKSNQTKL